MGLRIIIGEPEFDLYEQVRALLADAGHEVSWAKTGADAVRLCRETKADVLFVDAQAPEVPGAKACRQAKNERPALKTVLIGDAQPPEKGAAAAVNATLAKPVERRALERVMRDLFFRRPAPAPRREPAATEPPPQAKPADVPAAPPIQPEGSLAQVSIARLLHVHYREGRSGCLTVSREKTTKRIFLRDGVPVYVVSNVAAESLGRYLLAAGRIDLAAYNALLNAMIQTARPQTLLLIEKGFLSPHELYQAMEGLAREKLVQLFAWDAGTYKFQRGEFQIGGENLTPIPVAPLVLEGIRRHGDLTRLVHFFSEIKHHVPALAAAPAAAEALATLRPGDHPLVALIDGERTIGKIIGRSPLNLTETFQLLYFLLQVDAVRFVAVRQAAGKPHRARPEAGGRSSDLREYQALVERTYAILPRLDHFQVLGLERTAPTERIRAAYLGMTRQFRPFELHRESPLIIQEKANRIFDRLTEASEVLLDDARRAEFLGEMDEAREIGRIEREALERSRRQAPPAVPSPSPVPVPEPTPAPVEPPEPAPEPAPPVAPAKPPEPAEPEKPAARPPLPRPPVPRPVPRTLPEDDLRFDVFEIGVGETVTVERDVAIQWDEPDDASGQWKTTDPGEDLTALLAEGMQVTGEVANRLKGELAYQEGERLMEAGDFAGAAARFEDALAANPEEAEYHAFLGWSLYSQDPTDAPTITRARELIEQAVRMNPALDEAHYFLGRIALQEKAYPKAKAHFVRAIQCNPLHERAAEALRRL